MSIALLRTFDQSGAPVVQANAYGSIVDMLQAVLVDGYGDGPGDTILYPSLGWTKEYESDDTNVMVFRNNPNTGTGVYLQVSHSASFGLATNFFSYKLYESMTNWSTGLSPCPTSGTLASSRVGNTTGTSCLDGIHWMVIGDDKGFWLCLRPFLSAFPNIIGSDAGRYWDVLYFGDYISMNPGIIWNCFITGVPSGSSSSFGTCQAFNTSYSNYWCMRDSTYEIGAVNVGISSGSSYETSVIGKSNDISPVNNQTWYTPIFIHDTNNKVLGTLPGCRNPLRKAGDLGVQNYNQFDEEYSSLDRTLHLLQYRSVSETSVFPRIALISGEGFRNVL
jgi:hypothetical protein